MRFSTLSQSPFLMKDAQGALSNMMEGRHDHRDLGEKLAGEKSKRTAGLRQPITGLAVKVNAPLRRLERSNAAG